VRSDIGFFQINEDNNNNSDPSPRLSMAGRSRSV